MKTRNSHPTVTLALRIIDDYKDDPPIPPISAKGYPYKLSSFAQALRVKLGGMYSVHIVGKGIYVKRRKIGT